MTSAYDNYRISFKFLVRNGNCMAYPRDMETGSELQDGAITPNGFIIDMARSRYLIIDVVYAQLVTNDNGTVAADVRSHGPAKDGEAYAEDGIYTFDVSNQYTGEHTSKTVYVGDDEYLAMLAKNNWTIDQLNEWIVAEKEGETEDFTDYIVADGEGEDFEQDGALSASSRDGAFGMNDEGGAVGGLDVPMVPIAVCVFIIAAGIAIGTCIKRRKVNDSQDSVVDTDKTRDEKGGQ